MIRKVISGAVCMVAMIPLLYFYTLIPIRCNRMARVVRSRTLRNFHRADDFAARIQARDDGSRALACSAKMPQQIEFYMLAAANYRISGRLEDAAELYRKALQYEKRPEIYLNLGEVLLQNGQREAGLETLVTAATFYFDEGYIDYVMQHIAERDEVKSRFRKRLASMRKAEAAQ